MLALGALVLNYLPGGVRSGGGPRCSSSSSSAPAAARRCGGRGGPAPRSPGPSPASGAQAVLAGGGALLAVAAVVLAFVPLSATNATGYTEISIQPLEAGTGLGVQIAVGSGERDDSSYRLVVEFGEGEGEATQQLQLAPGQKQVLELEPTDPDRDRRWVDTRDRRPSSRKTARIPTGPSARYRPTSPRRGLGMTVATDLAVDIVIDNYNYAQFLGEAIDSALAQTHKKVRVIVVDDGSTDDSKDVLRGYEGKIEAVLKENGGHASAFNAGTARCRGDVVIFLDADDLLAPEAAARAARAFAADASVVKVQSRMEVVDAEGRSTGLVKPPPHIPMPNGDVRREELSQPFDLPWVPTSANSFRLEAMQRVMPIPEQEYRMCAERYLVHVITLLGPVVSLDEVGAYYRVHGDNAYESLNPQLNLDRLRRRSASSNRPRPGYCAWRRRSTSTTRPRSSPSPTSPTG